MELSKLLEKINEHQLSFIFSSSHFECYILRFQIIPLLSFETFAQASLSVSQKCINIFETIYSECSY